MARIRTIKPEFWQHEDLSRLPAEVHMLAAALLNHADDEGFFRANPALVKANCMPLREDSVSAHEALRQLSDMGYISLHEGVDGKRYGHIKKFTEHQRINRPTPSKIKDLISLTECSVSTHGGGSEDSHPEGNREGNREQGREYPPSEGSASETDGQVPVVEGPSSGNIIVAAMPLKDGTDYEITKEQRDHWQELFPAVRVDLSLGAMRAWCENNPGKRKTRRGVTRFITAWLTRDMNDGRNQRTPDRGGVAAGGGQPAGRRAPPEGGASVDQGESGDNYGGSSDEEIEAFTRRISGESG